MSAMNVHAPLVLTSIKSIGDELCESIAKRFDQHVTACLYENHKNQWSWNDQGALLLVVAGNGDAKDATRLIQEARLRRSPMRLALVCIGPDANELVGVEDHVDQRVAWPDD